MATCDSAISPHHSDDLIEVYAGSVEPRYICGYHIVREGL